jgi:ATP-dependent DNA helicase RecG
MEKLQHIALRYVKGIGPKKAKLFAKAGIESIEDLLYYFPRRYEDRTRLSTVAELKEGQPSTIKAKVLSSRQHTSFRRRGFSITEALVGDDSGAIVCVWFNQPYLKNYFKTGNCFILFGKVERYAGKLQMSSPEFEPTDTESEESLNSGRMVPIYSLPEGITQRNFRQLIKHCLERYLPKLVDFLPFEIRSRANLLNLAKSLLNIHFPESEQMQKQAYERLSFEEFLLFQLPLVIRKASRTQKQGIAHKVEGELTGEFLKRLPFTLTAGQQKALKEIKADMASALAMQRLLQGDVGSGKTVAATIASLMAIQGGHQAALMVPTEILAKQHYEKIKSQFSAQSAGRTTQSLSLEGVRICLLTGSGNSREKDRIAKEIKNGKIDLVIGTHALLEEGVQFLRLGLVIIDEQHKFGVGQRALLPRKGPNPDVLIMTATPIPRTLAITLYGDLDISVIRELPPGRGLVRTMVCTTEEKDKAYAVAREQVRQGRQVYSVYPVIEESYVLDIAGAKKMYEKFKTDEFKEFRTGLIHGRMAQSAQDTVMSQFKKGELDILVSTTVLEVGIDVPSATCMIVEHAERFGLAQLHQLRGRIGRGAHESFCLLISDASTQEAKARLSAMAKYTDGFRIAEQDLKIRGPGEFFGKRQHGLTELKVGNPLEQLQLLRQARQEAIRLVANDYELSAKNHAALKDKLLERFPEYKERTVAG